MGWSGVGGNSDPPLAMAGRFAALAALLLALAAAPVRSEVPCFDVPGCSGFYKNLLATIVMEWDEPNNKPPGVNNISVNNMDNFAECTHLRKTEALPFQYCLYQIKASLIASDPLFVSGTCENIKGGSSNCLPENDQFVLADLEVFGTPEGRRAYLERCPLLPGQSNETALSNMVEVAIVVEAVKSKEPSVLDFALQRTCGDHAQNPAAAGPVVMLVVSALLLALGVGPELAEFVARHAQQDGSGRRRDEDDELDDAPMTINTSKEEEALLLGSGGGGGRKGGRADGDDAAWWRQSTVLSAFHVPTNLGELFAKSGHRSLAGLDGLKGFSMLWIILAHTTLFGTFIGTTNPARPKNFVQEADNEFTASADLAVDTFFLVSGLLTSYVMLSKLRKLQKKPGPGKFALFFLLRWLRLVPLFMYVLFMYTFVAPITSSGPFWFKMAVDTGHCRDYWWTNLLHVNNFYPPEFSNTCMSWSWYLANDLQFYVVALVVMYVYLRSRRAGALLAAVVTVGSVVAGFVVVLRDDLAGRQDVFQNEFYDKPWARVSSYSIGLLFGMALRDTNLKKTRLSSLQAFAAASVCVLTMLFVFYIQATRFNMTSGYDHPLAPLKAQWTNAEFAVWNSFGRLAFVLSVVGLCTLNASGNGGLIFKFLTLPFWEALGKLTFGAYLIHPALLRVYYYQQTQLFQGSHINLTFVYAGTAAMGYGMSMVTYVLVELPFDKCVKAALGIGGRPRRG